MSTVSKPVNLAGSALTRSCHACAFFHTKEEEYQVLLPFIMEGFERGDRAFHIVGPGHRAEHLARLAREGVDTGAAEAQGTLEVLNWRETYLKDGRFDQDLMIETLLKMIDPDNAPPGKMSRNIANMEWALEDRSGMHDVVEYEARLNQALPAQHDPVVCTYDLSQFDASVVIDIMRTHPMVIIGGILQENPFFVPSGQMLEELQARRDAGMGRAGAGAAA
ncbi:MEDS domain-containing protein [Massilia jejuensis]|uniref:MEDS domain-containing protein n=1 Tax=Massilia jejuensis TaxID=648894 RepID=A0ABW0PLZ3_9BURK